MINVTIGQPRSGKTYRFMDKIAKECKLHQSDKSKYRYIYTNINGLNFDLFDGFVKRYDKKDLEKQMFKEMAFNTQKENGKIDLKEYDLDYDKFLLANGVYKEYANCLIIIDEAYDTFSEDFEKHKGRFLSYHGHFGMDIDLILQSTNQTNRKYLHHCEILYVAKPSGKRWNKNVFSYKRYSTFRQLKDNYIDTQTLKFSNDVAKLYSSGSNEKYKSFVGKKFLPIIVGAIFLYFYMNFFNGSSEQPQEEINGGELNVSIHNKRPLPTDPFVTSDGNFLSNKNYYKTDCYPDTCLFYGYTLQLGEVNLLKLINVFECKVLFYEQQSNNYSQYFLTCNSKMYDFMSQFQKNGDLKNEKTGRTSSIFN